MDIELIPFQEPVADYLLEWINTEADLIRWSGPYFTFPLQSEALTAYLRTASIRPPIRIIYQAVQKGTQTVVGHIELNDLDFNHLSASLSRVLVNPAFRRAGVCLPMVNAALQIAFQELHLHRISLRVYDFNHPAIRCYERAGFRREGFFRHHSRVGNEWWDSWSMAILEEDWQMLHGMQAGQNG